ncbi:PhoX family protein [Thioalkalivibrio sp. HK1]|uniref:PhoX family protein n=1 Tax=Thioalkalivibrio sp. HK1 TaxID=1469245 RepID=UPI000471E8BF|nr:PhoX family phosphatase [Thioalkalivibrio sp. HK1]
MTDHDLSFDEYDELNNPPPAETDFEGVVERAMSRRGFLHSTGAMGAAAFAMSAGFLVPSRTEATTAWLDFEPIAANGLDTVTLPKGFQWHIVTSWGDPLWSQGMDFDHETRGSGTSQAAAFGDNNDGMALFDIEGASVLVVNNEYVNQKIIYGNRASKKPESADDVMKGKAGHGVSIMQVRLEGGDGRARQWRVVKDAPLNRRITADTPMSLTGPARGHALLKTAADPSGTRSLGTWNNCGNGRTPWGTYLACEENFNGYFSSSDADFEIPAALKRYGINKEDWGYAWATADERFDVSKHPNEPNRAGYVVEIDPSDPSSTPKKRTALGRFKHENAEVVIAKDGRIVVYMGDDERGEFLYKFISAGKYAMGGDNADLLEDGALFVAKFDDDGTGKWVELTPQSTGMASKAEICIHTRQAASAVGATTMDRPEWVAVNPMKIEGYCCLTNNKNRGKKPNAGGDPTPAGGPNPRAGNLYGQIVRWHLEDHTSQDFEWDLFAIAGNPTVHEDDRQGSPNITDENMFNSPDGLAFDSQGGLWIQTDGNYSNEGDFAGHGNNQMLFADTVTGEIKRFMVGPNECEVTGFAWSTDKKTMFVGIQHPGEKGNSHFPGGGNSVPRSSIIAITREDGGMIG